MVPIRESAGDLLLMTVFIPPNHDVLLYACRPRNIYGIHSNIRSECCTRTRDLLILSSDRCEYILDYFSHVHHSRKI